MKAILLAFDSLNRHYLPAYGNPWIDAPNFARLARRTATFDRAYVGSLPCMPARRDLLTGRPNFLHRGWGPIEPWDDVFTDRLRREGVSSHLITDHYHYLEDGGATYHGRYDTWRCFRGQEGDPFWGQVTPPLVPPHINGKGRHQDWINRTLLRTEADWPQVKTFDAGLGFIARNASADRWFLQLETFDPHEPFTAPPAHQARYAHAGEQPLFDWPGYQDVSESPDEIERARHNYAALLSLCDAQLGRLLDTLDAHDLWHDTMLVVWTDHGFLLGEHGRWAKNIPQCWEEISHVPFFMWDPRSPLCVGTRRSALVQPSYDLAPTLLCYFGLEPGPHMSGHDLGPVLADDRPVRELAVFGQHELFLHATDGRHVYHRGITSPEIVAHDYTWMPTQMRGFWSPEQLAAFDGLEVLPFSNGMAVPRFRRPQGSGHALCEHHLYDLASDPAQAHPLDDPATEARLAEALAAELRRVHCPAARLARYGFTAG